MTTPPFPSRFALFVLQIQNDATHLYIPTLPCHFGGVDDQLLPKIGGETAQVTGRTDKVWAVAHYYVARLMRAAVGGGKITPA